MIKIFILLITFLVPLTLDGQGIRINELASSNKNSVVDDFGEYEDWIELYNPTRSDVNIAGWFLSDSRKKPLKSKIPATNLKATLIPPDSYLILWADRNPEQGPVHLDFRLSKEGEGIYLFRPEKENLVLIDSVLFEAMPKDKSLGRCPGREYEWTILKIPSPGLPNICPPMRKSSENKKAGKSRLLQNRYR